MTFLVNYYLCVNRNGVAMVYLKQEKFQSAAFHFTKATSIYRTNPDLICHLAVVGIYSFDLCILYDEECSFRLNINVINPLMHWHY